MKRIGCADAWTHKGIYVYRNREPGYKLRYTARAEDGRQFASDSLDGMRELINSWVRVKRYGK